MVTFFPLLWGKFHVRSFVMCFVLLFCDTISLNFTFPSLFTFAPRHYVSRKHHSLRLRFRPRYPRSRPRLRIRTVCQQRLLSLLVVLLPTLRSNPPRIDCDSRSTAFSLTILPRLSPQRFRLLLPIFVLRSLSFIERKCAIAELMSALSCPIHHTPTRCLRTTPEQASQNTESNM